MKLRLVQIFFTFVFTFFAFATPTLAQSPWTAGNRCVGSTTPGAGDVATIQGVECLVANLLATIITIVGIAAFVMFLIGGFRYLTAGSNTKGVESGKSAITYAIIGIVVALASYLILRFLATFTGVGSILLFTTQLPGSP
ncbi:MAG TPA: hypothetical protein VLH19_01105 [Patescibacteria group bacterium]|nr:hypothetical protein [Patescibacteria group bacterium]